MTGKIIFDFLDYKAYITHKVGPRGSRSGMRSRLAQTADCNTAYISQVLNGNAHFSLEQAEKINHLFDHTEDEAHFFLLMVQLGRAGTRQLQTYFSNQIKKINDARLNIQKRLGVKHFLSKVDQATYYSSWHYAAIHVALSVPGLRQPDHIAEYFNLPPLKVKKILEFLVSVNLAKEHLGDFHIGEAHIHLGSESENILRHHTNWRLKAIASLDRGHENDLHYASAITISKKDVDKIKNFIIDNLKEMNTQISDSKEEEVYCFTTDFFRLA